MAHTSDADAKARMRSKNRSMKALWQRMRKPLARSRIVKSLLVSIIAGAMKFIAVTNRRAKGSQDILVTLDAHSPAIFALWHGQHLLGPLFITPKFRFTALFSRSEDAELNALVAEKFGMAVVRGSGGREGVQQTNKGGARALIQLKRIIGAGSNVVMIADIPHGTPREAGLGIITLGRLSGRPIIPVAIATSRRKVLERSWDKTTINLPFGRSSLAIGEAVMVPMDADDVEMENQRQLLTIALNSATSRAYKMVDGLQ